MRFLIHMLWTLVPAGMMANAVVPGIENPDNVIPTLALSVLSPVLAGIFIAVFYRP